MLRLMTIANQEDRLPTIDEEGDYKKPRDKRTGRMQGGEQMPIQGITKIFPQTL